MTQNDEEMAKLLDMECGENDLSRNTQDFRHQNSKIKEAKLPPMAQLSKR